MIVVDASVAAKWILAEDYSEQAAALFTMAGSRNEPISAPPLLRFEVTNIIRRRIPIDGLTLEQADQLLQQFLAYPIDLVAPLELHRRALALAAALALTAAYDAHYLALAAMLECDFWTADERLINSLHGALPFVKWIGAYHGG
jgi:predicted nucleic acid-binding protein